MAIGKLTALAQLAQHPQAPCTQRVLLADSGGGAAGAAEVVQQRVAATARGWARSEGLGARRRRSNIRGCGGGSGSREGHGGWRAQRSTHPHCVIWGPRVRLMESKQPCVAAASCSRQPCIAPALGLADRALITVGAPINASHAHFLPACLTSLRSRCMGAARPCCGSHLQLGLPGGQHNFRLRGRSSHRVAPNQLPLFPHLGGLQSGVQQPAGGDQSGQGPQAQALPAHLPPAPQQQWRAAAPARRAPCWAMAA